MQRFNCLIRTLGTAVSLVLLSQTATALERAQTESGIAYVSGGVGQSELTALHVERSHYSLWVATVAKGSGAYLSDAQLRITSLDGNRVVLEHTMDGPWFFATLPPGRYEVSATLRPDGADAAETITRDVRIQRGGLRQAVLRFISSADVAAEREHPFNGNPFDGGAPAR